VICCILNHIYMSPMWLNVILITFSTKSHQNDIYLNSHNWYVAYYITYICRQGYLKTYMRCQAFLDHIFSCDIMSNTHRIVQAIPGVQCLQNWHVQNLSLRLLRVMAIMRLSCDRQRHVRTEATHSQAVHVVHVSPQVSNKTLSYTYFISIFGL